MITPRVLSAHTMMGDKVINSQGEDLGDLKEIMIDTESGCVAYAVLSFGGFMGLGDKYFAIPWEAFTVDGEREILVLDVDKDRLKDAPGFDKDNWPQSTDRTFISDVHSYYGYKPYWEKMHEPHI